MKCLVDQVVAIATAWVLLLSGCIMIILIYSRVCITYVLNIKYYIIYTASLSYVAT